MHPAGFRSSMPQQYGVTGLVVAVVANKPSTWLQDDQPALFRRLSSSKEGPQTHL